MSRHRYAHHQKLTVRSGDVYDGLTVEVAALLDKRCEAHNALCYGCILSGDHIAICEEQLVEFTSEQRRKLN